MLINRLCSSFAFVRREAESVIFTELLLSFLKDYKHSQLFYGQGAGALFLSRYCVQTLMVTSLAVTPPPAAVASSFCHTPVKLGPHLLQGVLKVKRTRSMLLMDPARVSNIFFTSAMICCST